MTASPPSVQGDKAERRRHYFIRKPFQRRFIIQFCLLMIVGCVSLGIAVYLYASRTLTTAFVDSKLRVMSTADYLLPALAIGVLAVTAIVSVVGAVRFLLLSHKIAGPLYRLEKTAEAVEGGALNFHVRLRAGDELQDVALAMEGMVQGLRDRAARIKQQTERLRSLVRQAEGLSELPRDFIREFKEIGSELDESVGRFQI